MRGGRDFPLLPFNIYVLHSSSNLQDKNLPYQKKKDYLLPQRDLQQHGRANNIESYYANTSDPSCRSSLLLLINEASVQSICTHIFTPRNPDPFTRVRCAALLFITNELSDPCVAWWVRMVRLPYVRHAGVRLEHRWSSRIKTLSLSRCFFDLKWIWETDGLADGHTHKKKHLTRN